MSVYPLFPENKTVIPGSRSSMPSPVLPESKTVIPGNRNIETTLPPDDPYVPPPTPPPPGPPTPPGNSWTMSMLRSFYWYPGVKEIFDGKGVPAQVWGAICLAESNGVPTAHNTVYPDDSVGLFQLNRIGGGHGTGYSVEYLMDPFNNASIEVNYIAPAYYEWYPDIREISRNCGHPGWVDYNDQRLININNIYNSLMNS
jgi:hypothetical protein